MRLYEARRAAKKTQAQVCKRLGISQSNLSDLERIAESSGFTAQLAAFYECDPNYLATGVGTPPAARPSDAYIKRHPLEDAVLTLASALQSLEDMDRNAVEQYLRSLVAEPSKGEMVAKRIHQIVATAGDSLRKRTGTLG